LSFGVSRKLFIIVLLFLIWSSFILKISLSNFSIVSSFTLIVYIASLIDSSWISYLGYFVSSFYKAFWNRSLYSFDTFFLPLFFNLLSFVNNEWTSGFSSFKRFVSFLIFLSNYSFKVVISFNIALKESSTSGKSFESVFPSF